MLVCVSACRLQRPPTSSPCISIIINVNCLSKMTVFINKSILWLDLGPSFPEFVRFPCILCTIIFKKAHIELIKQTNTVFRAFLYILRKSCPSGQLSVRHRIVLNLIIRLRLTRFPALTISPYCLEKSEHRKWVCSCGKYLKVSSFALLCRVMFRFCHVCFDAKY